MKKTVLFASLFLLAILPASCQREDPMPTTTTAAAEVYNQYATRKDLTVALIGDYHGYNAVMMQAQNNEAWLRLCKEFGVGKKVDVAALDSARITSITTGTTNGSGSIIRGGDTLHLPGIGIGEFFSGLLDSLSNEIARGNNPHVSITLDTSSHTITHRQHWENGTLVGESTDTIGGIDIPASQDRLLHAATDHGNSGYLVYGDSDALTLWLFFYSTKEEMDQIIDNVIMKRQVSPQGVR